MKCPVCGNPDSTLSLEDRDTGMFGLTNVRMKNVLVYKCTDCGEETISIPHHKSFVRELRLRVCRLNRRLTGREFAFLRQALNLNGHGCAEQIGVTNVTISRWENEAVPLDPMADKLLRAFTLCDLGHRQNVMASLSGVAKEGVNAIEIDMEEFNGRTFVLTVPVNVANGRQTADWKLVVNARRK